MKLPVLLNFYIFELVSFLIIHVITILGWS